MSESKKKNKYLLTLVYLIGGPFLVYCPNNSSKMCKTLDIDSHPLDNGHCW